MVVVALVLTKNSFGLRATSSSADLGRTVNKRVLRNECETYAATAKRTTRRLTVFILMVNLVLSGAHTLKETLL